MACFRFARKSIGVVRWQLPGHANPCRRISSRYRNNLVASAVGGREDRTDPEHKGDRRKAMDRSILGWLLIGLVAGVLGKLIMPGKDPGGFVVTILIGVAGAFLAGFIAKSMHVALVGGWENYAAATGGAVIVLALYRLIVTRRNR
ncbi:MAG: putative membrane protein YeaQ/YmgE (transglycosylase-associated protein family) [Sphingomonas echinoides]|jgi:uncharacterized membrane protein YeaQ/YmgE (transglycosylase-associated protein family)